MNLTTTNFPAARNANVPALDVEVAFTSLPTEGPIWRRITSDVRDISTVRGRPREFDRFSAGRLNITLDNNSRDYDPEYTSGPLYGHILPEKRVRVLASWNGTQYVVFDGFVDGWPQEWLDFGKDAKVQLSATDGFKVLAQAELPNGCPYEVEVLADRPLVWHRLGDFAASGTMVDSSGNGYHGTYSLGGASIAGLVAESSDTAVDFDGTDDYAQAATAVNVDDLIISGVYPCVEFWIKTTQVPAVQAVILSIRRGSDATPHILSLEADGHLEYNNNAADSTATVNDGNAHHVVLTPSGFYVDGALSGTTGVESRTSTAPLGVFVGFAPGSGSALGSYFDGTIDELAFYTSELSATRVLAHYNAGKAGASGAWGGEATGTRAVRLLDLAKWAGTGLSTSADRDIDTGSSTVAPTSFTGQAALDYLQTLHDTEQGQMYMGLDGALSSDSVFKFCWRQRHALITATRSNTSQATFSDTGSLRYADLELSYDETKVYNSASITRVDGVTANVNDTASQGKFFKRTYSLSGLLYASDNDSNDHANWAVARYADPLTRVEAVIIKPLDLPASLWPQVLGREIGDRITVTRNSISKELIIEGVEHDFDGEDWITTYRCSPADVGPYWLLDDATYSVLDTTTVLAF